MLIHLPSTLRMQLSRVCIRQHKFSLITCLIFDFWTTAHQSSKLLTVYRGKIKDHTQSENLLDQKRQLRSEVCSEITFCPQSIPDCPQILPLGLLIPQKKFHRPTPSGNSGSGHAHFFAYYLYR